MYAVCIDEKERRNESKLVDGFDGLDLERLENRENRKFHFHHRKFHANTVAGAGAEWDIGKGRRLWGVR